VEHDLPLLIGRRTGPVRRAAAPDARNLTQGLKETLRDIERDGLITRIVLSEIRAHVEYRLSGHGETVDRGYAQLGQQSSELGRRSTR